MRFPGKINIPAPQRETVDASTVNGLIDGRRQHRFARKDQNPAEGIMACVFSNMIEIEAGPQQIVDAFSDFEDWKYWMPGLETVLQLTDGPFGIGTQWKETRKIFGKQASEQFEVTDFDPPESLSLRVDGSKGTTGKGEYFYEYRFVGDETRTIVYLDGKIDMPGLAFRFFGKMLSSTFQKACDKDLQALKAYLEKPA